MWIFALLFVALLWWAARHAPKDKPKPPPARRRRKNQVAVRAMSNLRRSMVRRYGRG